MTRFKIALVLAVLAWSGVQRNARAVLASGVFPIATGSSDQGNAAIDGNIVVWMDNSGGELNIYGYDLTTGATFPVSTAAGAQAFPAVSGDVVVWEDRRNGDPQNSGDVYGRRLSTGQEFVVYEDTGPILNAYRPEISGDWVVWSEYRPEAGGYGVFGYNLTTQQEKTLQFGGANSAISLQLGGEVAVWQQHAGAGQQNDILGYDLAADAPLVVSDHPEHQYDPNTDGATVVWQDRRKGTPGDMDVYGRDLATGVEFAIDATTADTRDPAVDGDLVVWSAAGDLYGYRLSTGKKFLIAAGVSPQDLQISGRYVVWTTYNFGTNDFDVYGVQVVPEPATAALLLLGAAGLACCNVRR